jgi:hypothetical protein
MRSKRSKTWVFTFSRGYGLEDKPEFDVLSSVEDEVKQDQQEFNLQ